MRLACLLAALLAACAAPPRLAAPAPGPAPAPLEALLAELSASCRGRGDALLAEAQGAGRLRGCGAAGAVSERAGTRAALRCMSFLDLNRRLCALARAAPARDLARELAALQAAPAPAADTLCAAPGALGYGDLPEFPAYHANMRRVLVPHRCVAFCASEDITSDEPDYFCKALYWGTSILKNTSSSDTLISNNTASITTVNTHPSSDDTIQNNEESKPSEDESRLAIQAIQPAAEPAIQTVAGVLSSAAEVPPIPKSSTPITDAKPLVSGNSPLEENSHIRVDPKQSNGDIPPLAKNQSTDGSQTSGSDLKLSHAQNSISGVQLSSDHPQTDNKMAKANLHNTVAEHPTKMEEPEINKDKDLENSFDETARLLPGLELNPMITKKTPNVPNQANRPDPDGLDEDYDNQEQSEDPEKPLLEENLNEDRNKNILRTEQPAPPLSHNAYSNDRIPDFNPNVGDDFLEDDDSNFFPMFLSVVAMFALLYILYHNKNKIMGLLIEGRQNGSRRRNSRGHSYRRLDTLEQAISSSAAGAPPSKIIY